ncbi:MAG: phage tail sheath subtilisin-like domain-containing protein [Rhodanobacter sp.]
MNAVDIPRGDRTITGVATSIAAFVGWAAKGTVEHAELVLSWSDYVREFGGLDARSLLGYAVNQFFANGGQRAYIVRLVSSATSAKVMLGDAENGHVKLHIMARNPGIWMNDYAVITQKVTADDPEDTSRFRLLVADTREDPAGVIVEVFDNVSMRAGDARFIETVLEAESALILARASGEVPPTDTAMSELEVASEGKQLGVIPEAAKLAGGSDGPVLHPNDDEFEAALDLNTARNGVFLLDRIELFNLLCVPGETRDMTIRDLQKFCRDRRAFLIVDCAQNASFDALKTGPGGIVGNNASNAAIYFPWLVAPDPLQQNRPRAFPPCGFVAGLYARIDGQRGVWKAPAGHEASLNGVIDTKVRLTDDENATLNPLAINCIRHFPTSGPVVWGSRTLQGSNQRGSEWKYIPVRRTALFIEQSLYHGTKWVAFESNDELLWAQLRVNIGAFMHELFRRGAMSGTKPKEAYFVKCDRETTTPSDVDQGIVNIIVGFAPLKPAEFVVIQVQQIAGHIQT